MVVRNISRPLVSTPSPSLWHPSLQHPNFCVIVSERTLQTMSIMLDGWTTEWIMLRGSNVPFLRAGEYWQVNGGRCTRTNFALRAHTDQNSEACAIIRFRFDHSASSSVRDFVPWRVIILLFNHQLNLWSNHPTRRPLPTISQPYKSARPPHTSFIHIPSTLFRHHCTWAHGWRKNAREAEPPNAPPHPEEKSREGFG